MFRTWCYNKHMTEEKRPSSTRTYTKYIHLDLYKIQNLFGSQTEHNICTQLKSVSIHLMAVLIFHIWLMTYHTFDLPPWYSPRMPCISPYKAGSVVWSWIQWFSPPNIGLVRNPSLFWAQKIQLLLVGNKKKNGPSIEPRNLAPANYTLPGCSNSSVSSHTGNTFLHAFFTGLRLFTWKGWREVSIAQTSSKW